MTPAVSVLMPCHNGAAWLAEAIASVLAQTETDLELIVVDDGSTDTTHEILEHYEARDSRLIVLALGTSVGVTRALNAGLWLCRAPLVARLDADDVMRRDRLTVQRAYLEQHPTVGVVGSWSLLRWLDGRVTLDQSPVSSEEIRRTLRRRNPIAHPTVMMRRALLERVGWYDESFQVAQDYDCWARLSRITDLANLPMALTIRHMHPGQVSRRRTWARRWAQTRVRARLYGAEWFRVPTSWTVTA